MICHLSTRLRFAHQTGPNQTPIDKRRIKTILDHFRDKPARYPKILRSTEHDFKTKGFNMADLAFKRHISKTSNSKHEDNRKKVVSQLNL